MKTILGFKSDIELSSYLGTTPQSISKWKKRNSLDYELLISKLNNKVNLNWLFYGEGEPVSEKKKEGDKEEILLLREKIKEKDEQIKKQEIQKEVLQETIMKMTFYDHNGEEEVPEMYVREVAENSVNYK